MVSLIACLAGGCDDLADFRGDFKGPIVTGNFIRSCFPADTEVKLHFDPELAVEAPSGPVDASKLNRITTTDGTFSDTRLEPLSALPHDQLSDLDFPGPRRLRNFILVARPKSGPLVGRDATVVVSLLENGHVELRIMGRTADTTMACPTEAESTEPLGSVDDSDVERPREYFGVFTLK